VEGRTEIGRTRGRFRTQLLWRGGEDSPECYESSATIAGEANSNLICHETAHDAPANALTKIDAIRRAHGVRVVNGVLDSERPPARKTDRDFPNAEPIAKLNL
jgi:hypothetical protein